MVTLRESLRRIRGATIPIATTADLAPAVRRTRFLRIVLAALLVGLVVAATETGRSRAAAGRGLVPGGVGGMLVLDVSRSIKPDANRTISNVLQQLIDSHTRIGLVAFSDIAYELLPPGSPSSELRPLVKYFAPAKPKPGPDPFPPNPWTNSFSGGTQISSGLAVAHGRLTRNKFKAEGVPFRIVAVSPRQDNLSLFQNLAGKNAFTAPVARTSTTTGEAEGSGRGHVPWSLVTIALLVLGALAANELWVGRLPLPRTQS
jgi:hypothetical protein